MPVFPGISTRGLRLSGVAGLACIALLVTSGLARAGSAEEPPRLKPEPVIDEKTAEEISKHLAEARRAWHEANRLRAKARHALMSSDPADGDTLKLMKEQESYEDIAEKIYRRILDEHRRHPQTLADFGRFLYERHRYSEATVSLINALYHPHIEKVYEPDELADLHLRLGGLLERGGRVKKAVEHYRQARTLNARDPRTAVSLAVAQCQLGDHVEALKTLQPFLDKNDDGKAVMDGGPAVNALAWYTVAYAKEELDEPADAWDYYKLARRAARTAGPADLTGVAEQSRLALRRLDRDLREINSFKDRRDRFLTAKELIETGIKLRDQALAEKDTFEAARRNLLRAKKKADYDKAVEAQPIKQFFDALRYFETAVNASPQSARANRELAMGYLVIGRFDLALKHLKASALYDPANPQVFAALGEVCLVDEDWQGAREAFKRLMKVDPQYGPGHLGTAKALLKLRAHTKDLAQAAYALDRAETLGADPMAIDRLRGEIKDLNKRVASGERLRPVPSKHDREARKPDRGVRDLEKEIRMDSILGP